MSDQNIANNLAFVFPGQGSQSVGMLAKLAEQSAVIRATFDEASQVLGYDLWQLASQGPAEELNATERTQPAMLAAGIATWRLWLERERVMPAMVTGHSLGEFTALTAAGSIDFSTCVDLVRFRGKAMQEAVPLGTGSMAALLGLEDAEVEAACNEAAQGSVVEAVNFNAPGQVVIAGEKAAVLRAIEKAKARGAKRAIELPVSVPSHSSLMRAAGQRLGERLAATDIRAPRLRYLSAVDAREHTQPDDILEPGALDGDGRGPRRRWGAPDRRMRSGRRAGGIDQTHRKGPRHADFRARHPGILHGRRYRGRSLRNQMLQNANLQNDVALVTGASRGIGQAIAATLANAGARVVGTATSEAGAAGITAALGDKGRGAVLDVSSAASIDALLADLDARNEMPTILVNNAAITRDMLLLRMKPEDWDAVITTNLTSVFRLSKGVLKRMMKERRGRIVSLTSIVGLTGNPGQANYAAAKAGILGFTKSLAKEIASRGVTVNAVAPGFIDTDMTRALNDEQRAALTQQVPMARLGSVDDIAAAVLFLCSPGASYITGETLHVNGGMYMA
jgi:3-oxoacyl-[acyl-carrier protein] reductase